MSKHDNEQFGSTGRNRNGSPEFYNLLEMMAAIHDRKSHDYASNSDPFGNYHFAGEFAARFKNPHDAGFASRFAEKIYRLANLDNSNKVPLNETIEDTEIDICVIVALWMAARKERRSKNQINKSLADTNLGQSAAQKYRPLEERD